MVKSAVVPSMAFEASYGESAGNAEGQAEAGGRPTIDLIHLSRQTFGDHGLERELLTLFDCQAAQFAIRLAEPVEKSAQVWRAELAHTLKGSALAIGAVGVADAAALYEEALRCSRECELERDCLTAAIGEARDAIADLLTAA